MKRSIKKEIMVPEGVTVSYENRLFVAKGPKGEVSKAIYFPAIDIVIEADKVVVGCETCGKKEKKVLGTVAAHIKNLVIGATEGFEYKLKICSGHFPMNVKLSGKKLSVNNFLGEKIPRELTLKDGAEVKIDGDFITVKGNNIEVTGQVAADIEQLMRVTNKDRRIFQDGIYIISKNGKEV